ncbi:MAG: VaFE repeat-containing surface-anchored protein [Eisenbergiella sp.]
MKSCTVGEVIASSHTDLTDEHQSIHYPEIGTTALDGDTGNHTGTVSEKVTIEDTVKYTNLVPGKTYTIQGRLMVKETGEELLVDGEPVTAKLQFVPEEPDGSVTLTYELDSRNLSGQTVVVFEKLVYNGITVTGHEEIEDEAQSIHYPKIRTTALDQQTGSHLAAVGLETVIEDTVAYENLIRRALCHQW